MFLFYNSTILSHSHLCETVLQNNKAGFLPTFFIPDYLSSYSNNPIRALYTAVFKYSVLKRSYIYLLKIDKQNHSFPGWQEFDSTNWFHSLDLIV